MTKHSQACVQKELYPYCRGLQAHGFSQLSVSLSSLLNQEAGKSKQKILPVVVLCEPDCFQKNKILHKCCDMASVLKISVMQDAELSER